MKKILILILALFVSVAGMASTERKISGVVIAADGLGLPGAAVRSYPSLKTAVTDKDGKFSFTIGANDKKLIVSFLGFVTKTIPLTDKGTYRILLSEDQKALSEVVVTGYGATQKRTAMASMSMSRVAVGRAYAAAPKITDNESYSSINEIGFRRADKEPLSTFSIDVDAASYSNVRRFINSGSLPPKDAVRIEEMINYFDYQYEQPKGNDPVNIITEIAPAPWNPSHRLVHIGLQAKTIPTDNLPPSNLVFLIDVSGSMESENKLPLLVSSLKLLTDQLREQDKVAIVVYAGNAGLVLPPTSGNHKIKIKEALSRLSAGGSTAGGQGIELAYRVASENFIKNGNNRIILATDGDFNVGANSDSEMERLIEEKRKSGVFLTVLGYGMGNYKDSKMEKLADKGNGNYAYIDNITEAKKVLINEFGGTLFTLAKDVKFQLEFNPAKVQAYRLIGYENRMLASEDFNDDKKDAGELGSGHTVTALYEIIPVGEKSPFVGKVDDLKYQRPKKTAADSDEILTIKLRYKKPAGDVSTKMEQTVKDNFTALTVTSDNFRFSAAIAMFGMLLRQSEFKQQSSFEKVIALAEAAKGVDKEGYRSEFLSLARSTQLMAKDLLANVKGDK
ncbi:MAG: von Willebrand factor type A domain-containing protein [Pedobacter sp.]|nr:von Willebrand factor type A domain-containing protein [Pedobacter sp.]MDQ8052788.1 von Willebrand factor type A domain-containing protein [Pedobacter sp.]